MNTASVHFEIHHKKSGAVIVMDSLDLCDEYSLLAFSSQEERYNGIGRLPTLENVEGEGFEKELITDAYDVYVIINGVKNIWTGKTHSHGN